jgi:hypothetical protein
MSLAAGVRLGVYEIVELVGSGGKGLSHLFDNNRQRAADVTAADSRGARTASKGNR